MNFLPISRKERARAPSFVRESHPHSRKKKSCCLRRSGNSRTIVVQLQHAQQSPCNELNMFRFYAFRFNFYSDLMRKKSAIKSLVKLFPFHPAHSSRLASCYYLFLLSSIFIFLLPWRQKEISLCVKSQAFFMFLFFGALTLRYTSERATIDLISDCKFA